MKDLSTAEQGVITSQVDRSVEIVAVEQDFGDGDPPASGMGILRREARTAWRSGS